MSASGSALLGTAVKRRSPRIQHCLEGLAGVGFSREQAATIALGMEIAHEQFRRERFYDQHAFFEALVRAGLSSRQAEALAHVLGSVLGINAWKDAPAPGRFRITKTIRTLRGALLALVRPLSSVRTTPLGRLNSDATVSPVPVDPKITLEAAGRDFCHGQAIAKIVLVQASRRCA